MTETQRPPTSLTVFIVIANEHFGRALARSIAGRDSFRVVMGRPSESATLPASILGTTADLSPVECGTWSKAGLETIVLAPLPNDWQRGQYQDVQATYIGLDLDPRELPPVVFDALTRGGSGPKP